METKSPVKGEKIANYIVNIIIFIVKISIRPISILTQRPCFPLFPFLPMVRERNASFWKAMYLLL